MLSKQDPFVRVRVFVNDCEVIEQASPVVKDGGTDPVFGPFVMSSRIPGGKDDSVRLDLEFWHEAGVLNSELSIGKASVNASKLPMGRNVVELAVAVADGSTKGTAYVSVELSSPETDRVRVPAARADAASHLINLFFMLDRAKDGSISSEELRSALSTFHLPDSDDTVRRMMSQADTDGGGRIGFAEFVALLTRTAQVSSDDALLAFDEMPQYELQLGTSAFRGDSGWTDLLHAACNSDTRTLVTRIVRGAGLTNAGGSMLSAQDPYVLLSVTSAGASSATHKSPTIENGGTDPTFNFDSRFDFEACHAGQKATLNIEIRHEGGRMTSEKHIGTCSVDLTTLTHGWHDLTVPVTHVSTSGPAPGGNLHLEIALSGPAMAEDITALPLRVHQLVGTLASTVALDSMRACALLAILVGIFPEARKLACSAGAVDLLVGLLRGSDVSRAELAAGALANVALDASSHDAIVKAGAIDQLTRLLDESQNRAADNALTCLGNLAQSSDSIRATIFKAGICTSLAALLFSPVRPRSEQAALLLLALAAVKPSAWTTLRAVESTAVARLLIHRHETPAFSDDCLGVLAAQRLLKLISPRDLAGSGDGSLVLQARRFIKARANIVDVPATLSAVTHIRDLEGHMAKVTSSAFSPDGRTLVTGSEDRTARVYTTRDGALVRTLAGHGAGITSLCFSRYPKQTVDSHGTRTDIVECIVSASEDKSIRIWTASDGSVLRTISCPEDTIIHELAVTPDDTLLIGAGANHHVYIWSVADGAMISRLIQHTGPVNSVAVSPDGLLVVSGGADGKAILWSIKDGAMVRTVHAGSSPITCVRFSPNGQKLGLGTLDGHAHIMPVKPDESAGGIVELRAHPGRTHVPLVFTKDGTRFIVGSGKHLESWSTADLKPTVLPFSSKAESGLSMAIGLGGDRIVTTDSKNTARLWITAHF